MPIRSGLQPWRELQPIQLLRRNVIIWNGPSQLTGAPIFVIASAKTSNRKIGAMVQLWILTEQDPIAAVRSGADRAICGDCKFRGDGTGAKRTCYVEWWRAPENIHQFRHRAERSTPEAFARLASGRQLRIGAYGDPAAVPLSVWRPLILEAGGWTAYTHQWRTADVGYQGWCMASVDSFEEQRQAIAMGWRTFRVRRPGETVLGHEVVCPASEEGGHRAVCAECSLCRGAGRQAKHVVIAAHGTGAKWFPAALVRPSGQPRLVKPS